MKIGEKLVVETSAYFGTSASITSGGNITANTLTLNNGTSAQFLKANGTLDANTYLTTTTASSTYLPISLSGTANGIAPLGSNAKIPTQYIPDSILGQVKFIGTWNGSLSGSVSAANTVSGGYYVTQTSGSSIPNGGVSSQTLTILSALSAVGRPYWEVGDWIVSNGSTWDKVDNTDSISSWNGRVGAINPLSGDYSAWYVNKTGDTMTGNLTSTKFITNGGTSSQFVKGDGSLDTNTYLTTATVVTNVSAIAPIQTTNSTGAITLSHSTFGTSGTYGSTSTTSIITTNATGHVTNISTSAISITSSQVSDLSTTLSSYLTTATAASTYQPLKSVLTSIGNLSTTSAGFIKLTNGVASFDTNTYLTSNQSISLTGDITGSGTTSITTTLATVNATTGTFGSSASVASIITNGKGLITSASSVTISISHTQISDWSTYINQTLLTTSSPTFAGLTISNVGVTGTNFTLTGSESNNITNINYSNGVITTNSPNSGSAAQRQGLQFNWYANNYTIGTIRGSVTDDLGFGITYSGGTNLRWRCTNGTTYDYNALTVTGLITANGGISGTLTGHASLDLPLTGGTLTGALSVNGEITGASDIISTLSASDALSSASRIGVVNSDKSSGWLMSYGASGDLQYWNSPSSNSWSKLASLSSTGVLSAPSFMENGTTLSSKYLGISTSIPHTQISDWSTYINQTLLTTSSPTFSTMTATTAFYSKYGTIDGQYFSTSYSYASFGHKSCTSITNYCLLQDSSGNSFLNGAVNINFQIANVQWATATSSLFTVTIPTTFSGGLTLSTNTITSAYTLLASDQGKLIINNTQGSSSYNIVFPTTFGTTKFWCFISFTTTVTNTFGPASGTSWSFRGATRTAPINSSFAGIAVWDGVVWIVG